MAAADVVNAVNALLEMGGDESLDLFGTVSTDTNSEDSQALSRDKSKEAIVPFDEVNKVQYVPLNYSHLLCLFCHVATGEFKFISSQLAAVFQPSI
jgi:hypothetical protein